jgi:hypothetical protein
MTSTWSPPTCTATSPTPGGFERYTATRPNGEPVNYELRVTQVYRHENGRWPIAHRHGDHAMPVHPHRIGASFAGCRNHLTCVTPPPVRCTRTPTNAS